MDNTITFTYSPYYYFNSYKTALKNLRIYYPDSDVFVYVDENRNDIDKYNDVAVKYDCNFHLRGGDMTYINRTDPVDINTRKMTEMVNRWIHTCNNTTSKWIMLFEDDVLIKRKIHTWPTVECGRNRDRIGFLAGGSIFRRDKFLESVKLVDIQFIMSQYPITNWAGDELLKYIFLNNNATHARWTEIAEPNYYDETDHAVYHGYKDLHEL